MFGSQQKPAFGQTTTGTGFGTFSNTFGQSTFGKPAGSTFPAFGQQNTSLFAPTQPTTGGLFGGAGTTQAFGSTTATTQPAFGGFSQTNQNTSLFGAAQQNQPQTSLFGQSTTSAFGAAKPTGFGTFGQTQPTTSLFGQSTTAQTAGSSGFGTFGQSAGTSNVFGGQQTAFGQNTLNAGTGTAIVKYQPMTGTDTFMKNGASSNVNTKQHCITAMQQYENKSLEELRLEDYLANRKGVQTGGGVFGQTQPGTTGGIFGQTNPQPSGGLFGQQPTTENKNLFGTPGTLGNTGFGQTNTSAFGQTNQANSTFFGSKPFSAPATSSGGGFGFGGGTAFGQTTQASGFGQTTTGFGSFGATSQAQPSLFGTTTTDNKTPFGGLGTSTANTGFGGFGTNSNANTGGLFGSKPAGTAFGTGTGFGTSTSTVTGGFGGFGTTNTGSSLFGSTLNKPATSGFGGFGTQQPTLGNTLNFGSGNTSLFGNQANKPAGGLFGSAPTGTGAGNLFGTGSNFGAGTTPFGNFGTNTLTGGIGLSAPQPQSQLPIYNHMVALTVSPYGDNPLFKDLKPKESETDASKATNPATHKPILDAALGQLKISSSKKMNGVKVKPIGSVLTKKSLFDGLEEYDSSLDQSFILKPNAKRLIIKPKEVKSPSISKSDDTNRSFSINGQDKENYEMNQQKEQNTETTTSRRDSYGGSQSKVNNQESWLHGPHALEKLREQNRERENSGTNDTSKVDNSMSELLPRANSTATKIDDKLKNIGEQEQDKNRFRRQSLSVSYADDVSSNLDQSSANGNKSYNDGKSDELSTNIDTEPHPTGIVLRRSGYYTLPPLDDLVHYLTEDGKCIVPYFTVGRQGYGNVYFEGPLDVAGLNLDEIVYFRNKEIVLYPDDNNKPPVGVGLNREAQITLDQVWPIDKTMHEPIKDPERLIKMKYEEKLRRVCDKHETRFVEYRPETGSWVFKVKHFSKYGLNDSDEEENVPTDPKKQKLTPKETISDTSAANKDQEKMDKKSSRDSKQNELEQLQEMQNGLQSKDYFRNDLRRDLMVDLSSTYAVQNSSILQMPTSLTEALARGSGVDAQKLQMMKQSFFLDDDMDNKSIASESIDGRCTPDQTVPSRPFSLRNRDYYSSTQSLLMKDTMSSKSTLMDYRIDSPSLQLTTIDEGSKDYEVEKMSVQITLPKYEPLIIKPKIAQRKIVKPVSYENSIGIKLNGKCISDMALYNFRKFKVNFGPQNNLLILDGVNNKIKIFNNEIRLNEVSSGIHSEFGDLIPFVHNIKISSAQHYEDFDKTIENHLKIQLDHSLKVEVENSDCPYIKSNAGTELLTQHLNEAKKLIKFGDYESYVASVWSLCQSLWGDQEELEGQNQTNHFSIMCRKNLFSEWLENELSNMTNQELFTAKNQNKTAVNRYLNCLLDLLTCHKIYDACELAFRNDDVNLSLLLAQISGGPTIRQLIQHQLTLWQDVEADKFIDVERLKVFMLIAGVNLMSSTTHGPINVLEDLNWLKAIAVHLWYLCSPTSSITDALFEYEKSFNADEFYSLPPSPPYFDNCEVKSNDNKPLYDLRYHILKLYSKRSHPMESLLNPTTHTDDSMDFRLSWLLLQTFEALGYHHCSELAESQIHISFAQQLENNGLWHWAVFVLLHIKNKENRELCVQQLLYRYVSLNSNNCSLTDTEKFIINHLGIPQKWIHWAKAVKAGIIKNYRLQVDYLLKAKQFSLAHEIIMQHIAPDAIINDKVHDLYQLLIQFENDKPKKLSKAHNWSNQGQILLDYIEMDEKFKKLKTLHERDIETRWESLKPQLADLCSRINLLPCPTAKHRLCQSEISQKLACLIRGLLLTSKVLNPCQLIKTALEKLPLPQEYAQQELRVLLDCVVEKMMSLDDSLEKIQK